MERPRIRRPFLAAKSRNLPSLPRISPVFVAEFKKRDVLKDDLISGAFPGQRDPSVRKALTLIQGKKSSHSGPRRQFKSRPETGRRARKCAFAGPIRSRNSATEYGHGTPYATESNATASNCDCLNFCPVAGVAQPPAEKSTACFVLPYRALSRR